MQNVIDILIILWFMCSASLGLYYTPTFKSGTSFQIIFSFFFILLLSVNCSCIFLTLFEKNKDKIQLLVYSIILTAIVTSGMYYLNQF